MGVVGGEEYQRDDVEMERDLDIHNLVNQTHDDWGGWDGSGEELCRNVGRINYIGNLTSSLL